MTAQNIIKNCGDFSFIEKLGSFINNVEFSESYNHFQAHDNEKYSYIWDTLSAISEEYAEIVYENIVNYIDNVSNVDLCKVKALQSMMKILGIEFNLEQFTNNIPVEIINMIDLLSINRSYLLNSDKFKEEFIDELSSFGCIYESEISSSLSNEILEQEQGGISCLSDYNISKSIIDGDMYEKFLTNLFQNIMYSFIYMKYADAEIGISSLNEYIYQYIQNDLIEQASTADSYVINEHDSEIRELKQKYNIDSKFDSSEIVDNIENGYDKIENYSLYQQKILKSEIEYRQSTYSYQKTYLDTEKDIGYNITRYSYYREKKVREYFKFVESYYSNLLIQDELNKYIIDEKTALSVYNKDINYFCVNPKDQIHLLSYDKTEHITYINTSYIDKTAEILAKQTIQISEIREQIKLQMQKNYLKGTFLLLSYIINEYLKYNIINNYGEQFYTEEDVSLKDIMQKSITDGDNIELVEYYDNTEYYNIQTDNDDVAKNGSEANEKFWDNEFGKIGETSQDIPLEEIEQFYKKQLRLEKYQVDDVANFLSALFEYGKNTSFIYIGEDDDQFGYGTEHGDFTCQLRDGKFIGEPSKAIYKIEQNILSATTILDDMEKYIADGYEIPDCQISGQLYDYIEYLSTYYTNLLSSEGQSTKDEIIGDLDALSIQFAYYIQKVDKISSDYIGLKENEKYKPYYFSNFQEIDPAYLRDKLCNFKLSVESGFTWRNQVILDSLQEYLNRYNNLSGDLYNKLFKLSVWQNYPQEYWYYYSPSYSDELTVVTKTLRDYLDTQIEVNKQGAIDHLNNHYEKLNGFRSDMNVALQKCIDAENQLMAYKNGVLAGTGTNASDTRCEEWDVWDAVMAQGTKVSWDGESKTYSEESYTLDGYYMNIEYSSYGSIPSSGVDAILKALAERCNFFRYTVKQIGVRYVEYIIPNAKKWHKEVKDAYGEVWVFDHDGYEYKKAKEPHYLPQSKVYPYSEYRSTQTEADIKNSYDEAIEELKEKVKLINAELQCIGFPDVDSECSIEDLDRDNIHEKTSDIFESLVERITLLEEYLYNENMWKELDEDDQLQRYNNRLIRIKDITSNYISKYNIRYIDTTFFGIQNDLDNLLITYDDYFDEFLGLEGDRLDKQIKNLSNWVIKHDTQCSAEVYETISNLIVEHDDLVKNMIEYGSTMYREEISTIIISSHEFISYKIPYEFNPALSTYADGILSGDYIYDPPLSTDTGMVYWHMNAYTQLEESYAATIAFTVPLLPEYILSKMYAELARDKYLKPYLNSYDPMTDKMQYVIELYENDLAYIQSQISVYEKNKEIFLKYSGMDIGYDPYYNHKNTAYSSYQVHPDLYNFVEKSNLIYPLAKSFYVTFSEDYDKEIIELGLDNIIGQYGNVINLWKNVLYDYTGYKSAYESKIIDKTTNVNYENKNIGYTGLFYPPALDEFLTNREEFIQNVQDNNEKSYYKHLNLSNNEIQKIINQLIEYEGSIREIAQQQVDESIKPSLSNEYDIYKYCEDSNGNSLILLKSYKHLYKQNSGVENYQPSYNEKKNTPGELWMRIKDHPIAFPAFDLREGMDQTSQFNIIKTETSYGYDINQLVSDLNSHFESSELELKELTIDTVGIDSENTQRQYLRCFFDMEIDNTRSALLLNVSYPTGTYSKKYVDGFKHLLSFNYANSSIIVGLLVSEYDINNQMHIYSFTKDTTTYGEIDNIYNPGMIASNDGITTYSTNSNQTIKYDFIGFHNYNYLVYAIFIKKYMSTNSFVPVEGYKKITMQIHYAYYRVGSLLNTNTQYISNLRYDIFSPKKKIDIGSTNRYPASDYKYSNVIASACGNGILTLCFISQRIQDQKYSNNVKIVNYVEYSNMVENQTDISSYGENQSYPRDTALIQTDDAEHVNIYNSFDSFSQYIVNVELKFNGVKLKYNDTRYYNLHTDIGFLPVYADKCGTTRMNKNSSLSNNIEYNIELLGPEQTDVKFTPIIVNPTGGDIVPNGRVTEDYRPIESQSNYNDYNLYIYAGHNYGTYTWYLSDFFDKDALVDICETGQIFEYKYTLINTNYSSYPVLKGTLSSKYDQENYYMGNEWYDILSGEDIIGPNNITYQNVNMTNHINNISSIVSQVNYDNIEGYPYSITISCFVRKPFKIDKYIKSETFNLTIYVKNTLLSYKYYRILQNIDENRKDRYITQDELYEMDFDKIKELSSFEISSNGIIKKPFYNYSELSTPALMSADLNFKYSEEDTIDTEFPYLINTSIEDEVITLENKEQYTFFLQLNDINQLSILPFKIKRWYPSSGQYQDYTIDINQNKYKEFFDNSMKLQITYNLEQDEVTKENKIIIYYNYKNYTSPSYMKQVNEDIPPEYNVCDSTDKELQLTYCTLKPGQSGKIDLRYDFVFYDSIDEQDIEYRVVAKDSKVFNTYYIINVSDSKPKFIISKEPFQTNVKNSDDDTYEMLDTYTKGTFFRYFRIKINMNRGGNYLSFAKTAFYSKENGDEFTFPTNTEVVDIQNINEVIGHEAVKLVDGSLDTYFLGTWKDGQSGFTKPVYIVFDMKTKCLDIETYNIWRWYNAPNSSSHGSFIPKQFEVSFSNDKVMWFRGNYHYDSSESLPFASSALAYGRSGHYVGTKEEGLIEIEV